MASPTAPRRADAPAPIVEPDADWQAQSPYGLLRFNSTPAGRLVRLADLVRWLMRVQELPFAVAVRDVCAKLEGDKPPLLYYVDSNEFARPANTFSAWARFALSDDERAAGPQRALARLAARHLRATWLMVPHELARLANTPGEATE